VFFLLHSDRRLDPGDRARALLTLDGGSSTISRRSLIVLL